MFFTSNSREIDVAMKNPSRLEDSSSSIQSPIKHQRAEDVLQLIVAGTGPTVGTDFFESLVRHLAGALRVRYAFVSELCGEHRQRVRTVAWWEGTGIGDNFEYALAGTPCEKVFEQNGARYASDVQRQFPHDQWLRDNGVESYLAVPIYDPAGNPVGHLGVLHDGPMTDDLPRESILQIFAARAGAELERQRADEALRRYQWMVSASTDLMALVDRDYTYQAVNSAYAKIFGTTTEEIIGQRVAEIIGTEVFEERIKPHLDRCLTGKHVNYQHWLRVPGRGRRFLDAHYNPFLDEHGLVSGVVADIRDITEWKDSETKLRQHQDKLRILASEMSLSEERERRRIAADLHDRTVQNLALSRIKTGALRKSLSSEEGSTILTEIQALIDQTIHDTRSLVFELSPPVLYELGFEPAVEWLTEQMEARHGVACVVLSDKWPKPLDKDLEVVLFQAVRELLANVGKHAKATRVKVELSRKENTVYVSVGDNGIGFDVNSIGGWGNELGGFGLFSVRERLLLLGGRLEISSAPGSGTKITLVAPLGSGKGK